LRQIAQRFALTRRAAGTAAAALATLTTFAVLGAPSALAAGSVTIKTSFQQSPISLNQPDAIGYAFTNSTPAAETVTFTDALPAGVRLDNPVGFTNTNGTGACTTTPTSNPGDASVTLTVTVPNASGTVCTISFSGVAATPSSGDVPLPDAYSGVSAVITATGATTTAPTTTASNLIVLSNPTLSLLAPTNNQKFSLGQISDASFNCTDSDPLDSVDTFFGTDDEGNEILSGAPIDTVDPGAHSIEFDCYSAVGGGEVTQSLKYSVKPYTLTAVKSTKTDQVSFKSTLPAGKVVAEILDGKKVVGKTKVTVAAKKTLAVTVKPSTAGKKVLATTKGKTANVKLDVVFTPNAIGSGDSKILPSEPTEVIKSLKVAIAKPAKKKN
jgi:hypothetical protein